MPEVYDEIKSHLTMEREREVATFQIFSNSWLGRWQTLKEELTFCCLILSLWILNLFWSLEFLPSGIWNFYLLESGMFTSHQPQITASFIITIIMVIMVIMVI